MATAEFDRIADVYDETRRALDEETLNGIKEMLAKHDCHSILEIGVGTARVAMPLSKSGFEITGLDISKRMMEKAQTKGIRNLILAEGSKAPFRDQSFDATLMAHVFHLLQDPLSVMREAAKISRVGIFALIRKRPEGDNRGWPFFYGDNDLNNSSDTRIDSENEAARKIFEERRERFRKIAEKYGFKWDRAQRWRNWAREYEILEKYPPDDLKVVSDVVVNESFDERISRFEKGAYGFISSMPEEMRKEIIQEMRAYAASHPERTSQPRHEIYQVAMWKSKSLLL